MDEITKYTSENKITEVGLLNVMPRMYQIKMVLIHLNIYKIVYKLNKLYGKVLLNDKTC